MTARSAGKVWITRARPGALATAARVRALGFTPVVAPLLVVRAWGKEPIDLARQLLENDTIHPPSPSWGGRLAEGERGGVRSPQRALTREPHPSARKRSHPPSPPPTGGSKSLQAIVPIDLAGVGAIAFTSANAVAAFAARSPARDLPVFAVGGATAAAARRAGFASVASAEGDIDALAAAIAARSEAFTGAVLHPGATEPAGDLAGALVAVGIEARALAVYETASAPLPPGLYAMIGQFHAILVHSAKAARLLADILRQRPAPDARVCCLSPAVAASLRGVDPARLRVAALPNEDALLNLIVDPRFS